MITILCSGSRGDFQPYIALAQELKKLGKDVRITASKVFEDFIKSYGIDVYPISADIETLKVGIPSALASPFPMHKTKEYLSVVMYGKYNSNAITKKLSYAIIQGMLWMASKSSVNGFGKRILVTHLTILAALLNFLKSGEKPVYIDLGSMTSIEKHDGLAEIAVEALVKSRNRGIICGMG